MILSYELIQIIIENERRCAEFESSRPDGANKDIGERHTYIPVERSYFAGMVVDPCHDGDRDDAAAGEDDASSYDSGAAAAVLHEPSLSFGERWGALSDTHVEDSFTLIKDYYQRDSMS